MAGMAAMKNQLIANSDNLFGDNPSACLKRDL
jgi:hypothetical protein